MKKKIKMTLIIIAALIILIIAAVIIFFRTAPQIGANSKKNKTEKIIQSPNYAVDEKIFLNTVETNMSMSFKDMIKVTREFSRKDESRRPKDTIQTLSLNGNLNSEEVGFIWFGHSTLLVSMEGITILTDPVFSERASMLPFMGPKKFEYSNDFSPETLPNIDIVLISHDHYDHLDYKSIIALKNKAKKFFVPLGVAAHLENWGVDSSKIVELDWWQTANFENLELVCTPSRHFSGRRLNDRFKTLWSSWVINGKEHKVFFGGDSGYFPGFKEIGNKYGPFDIAFLECGAYNEMWSNIHMMPEETAQAAIDLNSKILFPIHWGKFDLALHPWKEPIERVTKKAEELNVNILTSIPGKYNTIDAAQSEKWWKNYN